MNDFLFAVPSALSGAARVVDLGGQFDIYNVSPTPEIADKRASLCDWRAVAKDLLQAAKIVAAEEREQEEQASA